MSKNTPHKEKKPTLNSKQYQTQEKIQQMDSRGPHQTTNRDNDGMQTERSNNLNEKNLGIIRYKKRNIKGRAF